MKALIVILLCMYGLFLSAYQWDDYCTEAYPIYGANFQYPMYDILCSTGMLIRSGFEWNIYFELPVQGAVKFDDENLILCMGEGTYSDGVYLYDLTTNSFQVIDWFIYPNFIKYNELDSRYHLGCINGMYRSYDGYRWIRDNAVGEDPAYHFDHYGNMFLMSNQQGIYRREYSEHPNFSNPVDQGLIELEEIEEASGVVASRDHANVFWTFNDTGGEAVLFAFNGDGEHLGKYIIDGITNRDWEDIAIGGGPGYQYYLYIADIGDNDGQYDYKYIYRIEEPNVNQNQEPVLETIFGAETITVQYPDGNFDAETLLHDPLTKDLYIVTKRLQSEPGGSDNVYLAAYPQSTEDINVMENVGTLDYPASQIPFSDLYAGATAGEISPLGDEILIKTYSHVYHWKRHHGQSIGEALGNDYQNVNYIMEPQGEAIGWEYHSNGYFTISEEPSSFFPAHLYYYDLNTWEMVSEFAALKGFRFDSQGQLYAYWPGESASSGLYRSNDFGETWDLCFISSNLSSIALDCDDNVFVGWLSNGVGLWSDDFNEPQMLNVGLSDLNINNLLNFPLVDCPSILACTENGAYFITDYVDVEDQNIPEINKELCNYPNPFFVSASKRFSSTVIAFTLKEIEEVKLIIYNIKGQEIKSFNYNEFKLINALEGRYSVRWNGDDKTGKSVSPGVYLYQLTTKKKNLIRKMLLVK